MVAPLWRLLEVSLPPRIPGHSGWRRSFLFLHETFHLATPLFGLTRHGCRGDLADPRSRPISHCDHRPRAKAGIFGRKGGLNIGTRRGWVPLDHRRVAETTPVSAPPQAAPAVRRPPSPRRSPPVPGEGRSRGAFSFDEAVRRSRHRGSATGGCPPSSVRVARRCMTAGSSSACRPLRFIESSSSPSCTW